VKKKVTFDPSLGDPANDKSSNGKYASPKNPNRSRSRNEADSASLDQSESKKDIYSTPLAKDSIRKRDPLDISHYDGKSRDIINQDFRETEETQQQTPQTSCITRFIQSLCASIIGRQGR
jgi:hypothetical protein